MNMTISILLFLHCIAAYDYEFEYDHIHWLVGVVIKKFEECTYGYSTLSTTLTLCTFNHIHTVISKSLMSIY